MQTPSLEQWSVLEDEFSNSLLETTEALLNASLRLPLDSKIKVYVVLVASTRKNLVPLLYKIFEFCFSNPG